MHQHNPPEATCEEGYASAQPRGALREVVCPHSYFSSEAKHDIISLCNWKIFKKNASKNSQR